eukprot:1141648-Pelagomonas_calceolata.AAC.2
MRGLMPAHALQHSRTPRTLHFHMTGIPSTISTAFFLKFSHGCNGHPHHSHTAPILYPTNLTDKQNDSVNLEAHNPPFSDLPTKKLATPFWINPMITPKHHTNVLKYGTGIVYIEKIMPIGPTPGSKSFPSLLDVCFVAKRTALTALP